MNIELQQLEIVKLLLGINDLQTLSKVKEIIINAEAEGRISIQQYNNELAAAEKRIDNGQFFTQDQVEKEAKEW